jgi:hypothetical protein
MKATRLINACNGFIGEVDKRLGDDFLSEESAQYSDMIERIMSLSDVEVNRVQKLIEKIEKERK